MPVFVTELTAKNFQDSFQGVAEANCISVADIETQCAGEFDQLRADILEVATENPDVAARVLGAVKVEREISEREGMPRRSRIISPIPQIMRSIVSIIPNT